MKRKKKGKYLDKSWKFAKFAERYMTDYQIIHIDETDSTNRWLKEHPSGQDTVVWTDFQTAGRGCGSNHWESEAGKNLLFSILIHPKNLLARHQFTISKAISVALCEVLSHYHIKEVSIKWPNDIYWRDRKLCGILIENTLSGERIRESVIGVGLNINQRTFLSDAPNPVSLLQILNKSTDRLEILNDILDTFDLGQEDLSSRYEDLLYRREGFYAYQDKSGIFNASIVSIEPDGHLLLCDEQGRQRRYAFKEVSFII